LKERSKRARRMDNVSKNRNHMQIRIVKCMNFVFYEGVEYNENGVILFQGESKDDQYWNGKCK